MRFIVAFVAASVACLNASGAARVFVASHGSDASNCSIDTPCRTFAGAINQVDSGGEIVALDSAGFGPVTITKSVSLVGANAHAAITTASGNAITISPPPTSGPPPSRVDVVLRGLSLKGAGGGGLATTIDISMIVPDVPASLTIENCVVSNFSSSGIEVVAVQTAKVRIVDTIVRNNGGAGISLQNVSGELINSKSIGNGDGVRIDNPRCGSMASVQISDVISAENGGAGFLLQGGASGCSAGASPSTRVLINRAVAANNGGPGFANQADPPSTISVGNSVAYRNVYGFANNNPGGFESFGNNLVRGNANADVVGPGPITTVATQ